MKTLWICLALAIGATGTSLKDQDYYEDYWYDEEIDKLGYREDEKEPSKTTIAVENDEKEESKDIITTNNFNDYQVEDNRLDLDVDNFENTKSVENNKPSKDNLSTSSGENIPEKAVTSADLNVNDFLTEVTKSINHIDKNLLAETTAILSEYTTNDFMEVKPKQEETSSDTKEIYEETSKILDETEETLEDNDELESFEDADASDEKIQKDSTEHPYINDLIAELDVLQKVKDDLTKADDENEFDNSEFDGSEEDDYEEIDDENFNRLFETYTENKEKPEESIIKQTTKISEPILYINDALIDSDNETHSSSTSPPVNVEVTSKIDTSAPTVHKTELLSSDEEDKLLEDFIPKFASDIEITADDIMNAKNIRLTVDTPVIITSPDYPLPYPTNAITDWMLTGDGMGIEMNITDFNINGHNDDYLLVKPGGIDVSGSSGLLFSYTLRTERRYRFIDVDKMFVRFEANLGMQFMRGFSFSVRMVVPRPGAIEIPEPEPVPERPLYPNSTLTLNLGGVTLTEFLAKEERFRQIIADMATMYIDAMGIDPGMNTTLKRLGHEVEVTRISLKRFHLALSPQLVRGRLAHFTPKESELRFSGEMQQAFLPQFPADRTCTVIVRLETTQITSTALCFHNWPKFERCAEVRFGVPLVYNHTDEQRLNETDLVNMWYIYNQRDPFATRLRMLGITEFQIPNDKGVMIVWMVIAGGVVISMALLAFVLWRYSCFKEYSRMPSFSDTDSVNEKRKLDLYPTPHQSLPPLYSEIDYQWADAKYEDTAKVDIGGFSNKSYMQNDLYDIDSDEDAMPARDRSSGFSPRDIYNA